VSWSIELEPISGMKGLGRSDVLSGQNLSPRPPAMITAYIADITTTFLHI
jgi:hypothetical protein